MGSLVGAEALHWINPKRIGQLHDQQWVGTLSMEGDQVAPDNGRQISRTYACEVGRPLGVLFGSGAKLGVSDDAEDDLIQG